MSGDMWLKGWQLTTPIKPRRSVLDLLNEHLPALELPQETQSFSTRPPPYFEFTLSGITQGAPSVKWSRGVDPLTGRPLETPLRDLLAHRGYTLAEIRDRCDRILEDPGYWIDERAVIATVADYQPPPQPAREPEPQPVGPRAYRARQLEWLRGRR
jgi:hypothetical protein